MLRVKRQCRLSRDVDLANKRSFFENAALVIAQDLSDATEFTNETCDTGVGGWCVLPTPVSHVSLVNWVASLKSCAMTKAAFSEKERLFARSTSGQRRNRR